MSDHDRGLQESVRCKALLADPAKPPPVVKRTINEMGEHVGTTALWWTLNIAILTATLIVSLIWLRGYAEERHAVQVSIAKSDISKIHKRGVRTGHMDATLLAWTRKPAQEHDEWEASDDADYIGQTGAGVGETASEVDCDDGETRVSLAANLCKERIGIDEALDDLPDYNSLDCPSSNPPEYLAFAIDNPLPLPRSAIGGHMISLPLVEEVDAERTELILFEGPISALKLRDSIGTRDLRVLPKSTSNLRAIKIPVEPGETIFELMASDMLTPEERRRMPGKYLHKIVWESTLNTSERMSRRLSRSSSDCRYIHVILDLEYVKRACPEMQTDDEKERLKIQRHQDFSLSHDPDERPTSGKQWAERTWTERTWKEKSWIQKRWIQKRL
jgi:hypothetical protein